MIHFRLRQLTNEPEEETKETWSYYLDILYTNSCSFYEKGTKDQLKILNNRESRWMKNKTMLPRLL